MIRTFLFLNGTSSLFSKQLAEEEQSSHLSLTLDYVIVNSLSSETYSYVLSDNVLVAGPRSAELFRREWLNVLSLKLLILHTSRRTFL